MKKTYGVAPVSQKEYAEAAAQTGGGGAVARPLVKFDGDNAKLIAGEFTLPDASECKQSLQEVALRVLGILVTDKLLAHLPGNFTGEHLGMLNPYYAFSYHKRIGPTWTDRVCPASTRTGHCPACEGRIALFKEEKKGLVKKEDIGKSGFYTRNEALVIARVYFDGEDLGIRTFLVPLTNEKALNAKRDNFFDLVDQLMTPKKLLAGESLPLDYYSNGDGARWLIAEYVKAIYQDDGKGDAGEQKSKRPARPYWKLSKITPTKEIPGVGKAEDIWWPAVGTGKAARDGAEVVDVYDLINHSPVEEFAAAVKESVDALLKPKTAGQQRQPADKPAEARPAPQRPATTPTPASLTTPPSRPWTAPWCG